MPRQRPPPPPPPPSAPGLFANVFSFVSRELESFVSTATGADPKVPTRPLASSSRVTLDQEDEEDTTQANGSKARRKHVRRTDESRRRRHSRVESGSEDEPPPRRRAARKSPSPAPSSSPSPPPPPRRKVRTPPDQHSGPEEAAHSLPPPSIPDYFMPSPSVTMPGSLFPRSPSLQPDPIPQRTVDAARRVRFVPSSPTPPPRETSEEPEEDELTPSPEVRQEKRRDNAKGSRAGTTAVKEAAGRFAKDADYSLMFPTSPELRREKTVERSERGRRRESSTERGRAKTGREKSRERLAQEVREKSREREESTDEDEAEEEDLEYIPSKTAKAKGKQRALDTSGEIQVQGKERELRAAREAHSRSEAARDIEERERDKERIRMLEEEIGCLKAQLAVRSQHAPSHSLQPPPPPPPPPPLSLADMSARTSNFLLSVRAGLKHTDPPVEAPINAPPRTRKTGQPTVNVPTDKMAAFLSEMKTVRLRKVSGSASGSMPPPVSTISLARSMSNGSTQKYAYGERSFNAVEACIGEKRKRDAAVNDGPTFPAKRRYTNVTPLSSGSSFASSSISAPSDSRPPIPGPSSFSQSYPGPPGLPPRTWPSVSTTETDLTTPSLCSDNENDHDHEQDSEEHRPHTPPTPPEERLALPPQQHARKLPAEKISAEVNSDELPQATGPLPEPRSDASTPAKAPPSRTDVFARRTPQSPMPAPTPRKPRPPARARAKPAPVPDHDASDGDDPLSLSYSPPRVNRPLSRADPLLLKLPRPFKQSTKKGARRVPRDVGDSTFSAASTQNASQPPAAPSNAARRRRTLDDELRRAGDGLWSGDTEDGDLESGELVGVGSKSTKRGFLKGGGAAGTPVFMGVGYIQDAEDEDGGEEGIRLPWKGRKAKAKRR
ncbi:hypothetical protein B0H21DRAFT_748224 [Amylocystis lapponica]|nr:hypothetical protein B0H21DRAFT_748224 [Amylocystis lapponica]